MKFTSLVLLVASASAAGPADWTVCIDQTCKTKTYACCNMITTSASAIDTTGSMICADPATVNGLIPSGTYTNGRFLCSTTQLKAFIKATGAVQLAAGGALAAASAYYLY